MVSEEIMLSHLEVNQNHAAITTTIAPHRRTMAKTMSATRKSNYMDFGAKQVKPKPPTEQQKFKVSLRPWKELIIYTDSLLRFEDPQGFCTVFFSVTTFILIGRYFNPSAITTISLIVLFCTLFEMMAPTLIKKFFAQSDWLPMHESRFDTLSEMLFDIRQRVVQAYRFILKMKRERPIIFLCTFVPFLTFVTLFGWKANNWTCAYIVVVAIFVLPGMIYHGLFGRLGIQFVKVLQVNFGITPRRK